MSELTLAPADAPQLVRAPGRPDEPPRCSTLLDCTRTQVNDWSPAARLRITRTQLHDGPRYTVDVWLAGHGLTGTLDAPDEPTALQLAALFMGEPDEPDARTAPGWRCSGPLALPEEQRRQDRDAELALTALRKAIACHVRDSFDATVTLTLQLARDAVPAGRPELKRALDELAANVRAIQSMTSSLRRIEQRAPANS